MGQDLVDLKVEIAGLTLKNPLIISSGCLEYDKDLEDIIPVNELGALVTKTLTLEPRQGNPSPRTVEVKSGLLNSIGLQNKGLYYYISNILPQLRESVQVPIICSIAGFTIEEYSRLASHLEREEGISALEINISCPNLEKGEKENKIFAQDEYMSYGVVKAVRESTDKPLIVKLSPEVTDIRTIAQAVLDAGCDALTVANTYPALAIDLETRRPRLGTLSAGLSGPAIKPLTLRKVWDVYNIVDVPIIASGGIMDKNDALEYIIAGASVVSLGTVNFINPRAALEILKGLQNYLKKNNISYEQLRGSLKYEAV